MSMCCPAKAVGVSYLKCYLRTDSKFRIEFCGKNAAHLNRLQNRNMENQKETLKEQNYFENAILICPNHCVT